MWRVGFTKGTDDDSVADVAHGTRHALVAECLIEGLIRSQNGLNLVAIPKTQNQILLLVPQRCVAIETNLLGAVELEVHLEVGIGPRAGMHAARPLLIRVAVTAPTVAR